MESATCGAAIFYTNIVLIVHYTGFGFFNSSNYSNLSGYLITECLSLSEENYTTRDFSYESVISEWKNPQNWQHYWQQAYIFTCPLFLERKLTNIFVITLWHSEEDF